MYLVNIFRDTQHFYFGEVIHPPKGRWGPRIQDDLQLFIIQSGEVTVEVDDRSYRVGAHEVTLLQPGRRELFLYSEKTPTRQSWCTARLSLLSNDVCKRLNRLPSIFTWTSRMENVFRLGLESQIWLPECYGSPVVDHLAQALFYEFFFRNGVFLETWKIDASVCREGDAVYVL